jgi:hypothetical protein
MTISARAQRLGRRLLLPFGLGLSLQICWNVRQIVNYVDAVTPKNLDLDASTLGALVTDAAAAGGGAKRDQTATVETVRGPESPAIGPRQRTQRTPPPTTTTALQNSTALPRKDDIKPLLGFVRGNDVNETIVHFPVCDTANVCCAPWDVDLDPWWQHNPPWRVSSENDTHFCFSQLPVRSKTDQEHAAFLLALHEVQWHGNCSTVHARPQINSGFSASLNFLHKGFITAWATKRPFQITQQKETFAWTYATYENQTGVCPTRDARCYFLPVSNCQARIKQNDGDGLFHDYIKEYQGRWLREYLTRPRQWLRKRLYEYQKSAAWPNLQAPCSVLHVRRTDVTLEKAMRKKRRYFPISDYVKHVIPGSNILLMTDDQSAVDEALGLHPNYTWYFINRTRHYGASGGLNHHIPSQDPLLEIIIILAELRLASHCKTLIHTHSGFVDLIREAVQSTPGNHEIIKIDQGIQPNSTWWESSAEFFRKHNLSLTKQG